MTEARRDSATGHPPKPKLTFRVGVVGHRPDHLPPDLETLRLVVRGILEDIADGVRRFRAAGPELYASDETVYRVVSPLAEGADRLVAEQAIALGFELQCPMPFPQEEYEKDFLPPHALSPDSLQAFRDLLARSAPNHGAVRFEYDGDRSDETSAYGAIGRVVLNQSDVLLAIWDGGQARGRGGTAEKVKEALRFHVPIVWVDAASPHSWRIVRSEADLSRRDAAGRDAPRLEGAIRDLVAGILRPPDSLRDTQDVNATERGDLRPVYFRETRPAANLAFAWRFFRDLVGDRRLGVPSPRVPRFDRDPGKDWPGTTDPASLQIEPRLRRHYAWADGLADYYADRYRGAFVCGYLFSVVAVFVALLPFTFPAHGAPDHSLDQRMHVAATLCTVLEIAVILSILGIVGAAWRRRWHERWMDYRLVAELVRQLRFVLPLGGWRPFPRVPPFLAGYGDPSETWMYWHVRAVERNVGLPSVRLDPRTLGETLRGLKSVSSSQRAFHETTHARAARIAHRLHATGYFLFLSTFAICLAHLVLLSPLLGIAENAHPHWPSEAWLPVLCAVLPALGAALAGISNHGEFSRVAKRSRAMAERLGQIERRVNEALARAETQRAADVTSIASELAQLMVNEVLDWRVVFKDRPPVLPT